MTQNPVMSRQRQRATNLVAMPRTLREAWDEVQLEVVLDGRRRRAAQTRSAQLFALARALGCSAEDYAVVGLSRQVARMVMLGRAHAVEPLAALVVLAWVRLAWRADEASGAAQGVEAALVAAVADPLPPFGEGPEAGR